MPTTREIPRWVYAGGFVLSGTAGFVNAVTVASAEVPVSHMSGTLTHLAIGLAGGGERDLLIRLAGMLGGFVVGAMLSGIIVGASALQAGRRYGVALVIEGLLFGVSTWTLTHDLTWGIVLSATACGLQNAMAATYYGLVVRTTHMTGILTDFGVLIGQRIRTGRVEWWRLWMLTVLMVGFFLGGVVGAGVCFVFGDNALWVPAGGCLIAGVGYLFARQLSTRAVSAEGASAD